MRSRLVRRRAARSGRACKASPHYKLLYQVSIDLQEDWKAIEYFRRYLREGGGELAEARRTDVEQRSLVWRSDWRG
jgi:hypothetical protein